MSEWRLAIPVEGCIDDDMYMYSMLSTVSITKLSIVLSSVVVGVTHAVSRFSRVTVAAIDARRSLSEIPTFDCCPCGHFFVRYTLFLGRSISKCVAVSSEASFDYAASAARPIQKQGFTGRCSNM
jgi:hypothetical protein